MATIDFNQVDPTIARIVADFTKEAPVKIGGLASALGIVVTVGTLRPGISGEIRPHPDFVGRYQIRVNRHEKKERQRFTLAHEIGHFLFHRDRIGDGISDDILYRSGLSDRMEAEANRAAAEMLMPRDLVLHRLAQLGGIKDERTAAALAEIFEVSVPAMKIRIGM